MQQYVNIYTVTELICFFIALFLLIRDSDLTWKMLIPFLLITCVVEMGTIPMKKLYRENPIPENSNAWVFNILLLFQMCMFSLMFEHLLNKYKNSKLLIISGIALLVIIYIYELFFKNTNGVFDYNSITDSVMSVIFVCYSLYFFYLLLKDNDYVNLKHSAEFWWVTGTLIFYSGSTTCNLFYEILKKEPATNKAYLTSISDILIVILYSSWSYSFICKRWLTKT